MLLGADISHTHTHRSVQSCLYLRMHTHTHTHTCMHFFGSKIGLPFAKQKPPKRCRSKTSMEKLSAQISAVVEDMERRPCWAPVTAMM